MNVISFLNKYKYIIILLILVIYLILLWRKTEGFDNSFKQYRGLPPQSDFDSVKGKYNYIFGFHKGGGFRKKTISKNNDFDNKISTLNKLLDKLLNKFISYDQDCEGEFTKYSDCDKDCGNGKQTRQFTILKEKGKRGEDCKYEDGYTETIDCYGGICQNKDKCELNEDCIEKNCNPDTGKCEKWKPCSENRLYMCDRTTCKDLNDKNLNSSYVANGSYLWNHTDDACFFKTPAEMKTIEKNIYKYSYDDPTSSKYEGECIYYQVNDGHGKCDFRENIELDENEKPVCKKGWGPEPTTMNIKDACTCCVNDTPKCPDDRGYSKSCMCDDGKIFSREGGEWKCQTVDLNHMPGSCPKYQVRKKGECAPCGIYEKWVPDVGMDYGGHCSSCPPGKMTGRAAGKDDSETCVIDACHDSNPLLVSKGGTLWPRDTPMLNSDAVITASGYESLCRCIDQNATFHSEGTAEDSCHCNEGYKRVESFGLCENDCAPNTILSADGNCTPCGDNEAAVEGACAECTMGFPKVDGSGCVTCAVAQGTLPSGTKWGRRPAATPRPEESEMRYLQIIENESEPAPMKFECEGDDGEEEKVEIPIVQCDASGLVSGYLNGHQVPAETDAVCAAYSPAR